VASFVSTFINKVDRKGRVSVPASFRASLSGQKFNGIVAFRSFKHAAIDAGGFDRLEKMSASLEAIEEFSEHYEIVSSIFADTEQLAFDGEGRIVLSESLITHAGIEESAAFVGLGLTFQIWEPERHKAHQADMRERAKTKGVTLPSARGVAS